MIGKNLTKKQKLQLFFLLLIALIMIGAAVYALLVPSDDERVHVVYKEETVQRGNVVQGVTENGNLTLEESSVVYDLVLESEDGDEEDEDEEEEDSVSYLEIDTVYVVSSQRINPGDPLFSLTKESMEAVEKKIRSQITQTKIEYDDASAAYQSDLLSAKSTYNQSTLTAKNADAVKKASTIMLQKEMNALEAEIAVLELEINQCLESRTDEDFIEAYNQSVLDLENAKKDLDETLIASAAAYSANYSAYKSALDQYESYEKQIKDWEETIANNQEKIIQNQLDMLDLSKDLEAELLQIENTYQLSKESGELAEKIYTYTQDSLSDTVDLAQTEYEQACELLEKYQAFVGTDGVVYASESGMVTAVAYESGDELTAAGDVVSYVKTDAYTVTVDVSEEDIALISIGDTVDVAFDAYTGEAFSGTVAAITTTKTSDIAKTVSYPVTILVSGDTEKLFGGMTAGITFVTEQVTDVLYVSKKAVIRQDGKTYVYVNGTGEEKVLKEVKAGFENSTVTEITDGLSEGETVYIQSQASEELE